MMRKVYEADAEMQAAYDEAYSRYEERLAEWEALPWLQRRTNKRPKWNRVAPGYYEITVTHYFDGTVSDGEWESGRWVKSTQRDVYVNDYSPFWYEERQRAVEAAQRRREMEMAMMQENMWRANVGEAYYDLNQPWAWQSWNYY